MLISNRASAMAGVVAGGFRSRYLILQQVTVTIASGKVSAALSGFQVKVDLADLPSAFWAGVTYGGGNLRAYTTAGAPLPLDIPFIDTANRVGWAFVRIDVPTAGVQFYLRTLSGGTEVDPSSTYGRVAVWSGMAAVFSGNSLVNRASASAVWTPKTGTTADLTTRPGWLYLNPDMTTRGPVLTPTVPYNNLYWTLSCVCRYDKPVGGLINDQTFLSYANGDWAASGVDKYYCAFGRSGNGNANVDNLFDWYNNNGRGGGSTVTNGFPAGYDNHISLTVSGYAQSFFVNGASVKSFSVADYLFNASAFNTPRMVLGVYAPLTGAVCSTGCITDAYMCAKVQPAARLKAESDNWNWTRNGKGFYTIAA